MFGYPDGPSVSYLDAVVGWQARRFGWEVPREWVLVTAGIITTLKTVVQAFSAPGDSVLIQPPVYAHFLHPQPSAQPDRERLVRGRTAHDGGDLRAARGAGRRGRDPPGPDHQLVEEARPVRLAGAGVRTYTHGEPWLEELLTYLRGNHRRFADTVNSATDKLRVLSADSLYLTWMDCRGLGLDAEALDKFMLTKARLWLDEGQKFGVEGHGYMRVNLGCPRSTVDEAITRLVTAVG
ncbi:aminotransferase class I/II-fold pyridoxal phosphate-dependent enzyme [Kribbella sp. WER1]